MKFNEQFTDTVISISLIVLLILTAISFVSVLLNWAITMWR